MDRGVSGRRFVQGGWNPSSYKQFRTFQTVVQFSETVESKTTFKSLLCNCSNGLILPSFQTTRVQIISSFCFTFFVFRDLRMGKYVHVAFFLFFHSMIRWFPQVELHKASAPLSHIQGLQEHGKSLSETVERTTGAKSFAFPLFNDFLKTIVSLVPPGSGLS